MTTTGKTAAGVGMALLIFLIGYQLGRIHEGGVSSERRGVAGESSISENTVSILSAHSEQHSKQGTSQGGDDLDESPEWNSLQLYGSIGKPDARQVKAYLEREKHSTDSLLTIAAVTKDVSYIRQAAERDPENPQVQLAVILNKAYDDTSGWIERFKGSSPANAMGNYLAAQLALEEGDIERVILELEQGSGKTIDVFHRERALDAQSLYDMMGEDPVQAMAVSSVGFAMPHGVVMSEFAEQMVSKAQEIAEAGDSATAATLVSQGLVMSNQMASQEPSHSFPSLLATIMEKQFLDFLKEGGNGLADHLHRPLDEFVQEVEEDEQAILHLHSRNDGSIAEMLQAAGRDAAVEYFRRLSILGEWEAVKWLQSRQNGLTEAAPIEKNSTP